jgi:hypothetical protein
MGNRFFGNTGYTSVCGHYYCILEVWGEKERVITRCKQESKGLYEGVIAGLPEQVGQ